MADVRCLLLLSLLSKTNPSQIPDLGEFCIYIGTPKVPFYRAIYSLFLAFFFFFFMGLYIPWGS